MYSTTESDIAVFRHQRRGAGVIWKNADIAFCYVGDLLSEKGTYV